MKITEQTKAEAKALIDSFRKYVDSDVSSDSGNLVFNRMQETEQAKKCAIIAVKFAKQKLYLANPINKVDFSEYDQLIHAIESL